MSIGQAYATPFSNYDPRSMAMGGVGVASSHSNHATNFNPALLANNVDDFSLNLPTLGGRVTDRDNLADAAQDFWDQDLVNRLSNDIASYNNSLTSITPAQTINSLKKIERAVRTLSNKLNSLSDKPLQAETGINIGFALPGMENGSAFSISSVASGSAIGFYRDKNLLRNVGEDINTLASCLQQALNTQTLCNQPSLNFIDNNGQVTFDPLDSTNGITSSANARGLNLLEVSLSFAHYFPQYDLNVGITPKYVTAELFDFTADIDLANTPFLVSDYITTTENFNADIGISKTVKIKNNSVEVGAILKNILPQTYRSGLGNEVTLNPQLRVGAAYRAADWVMVAVDMDLTRNDAIAFEDASQFIGVGAEIDSWRWAQWRMGYRFDLVNSDRNTFSAGLGLSPFGVHLDLAITANSNRTEIGSALQLAFRY
ncbi:MAG: conjugal transfer protein TraF [Gammaproteobacteria bacterium]|nr:conjugal transfer protein TraF [Gammaproteobacteria bacterium]